MNCGILFKLLHLSCLFSQTWKERYSHLPFFCTYEMCKFVSTQFGQKKYKIWMELNSFLFSISFQIIRESHHVFHIFSFLSYFHPTQHKPRWCLGHWLLHITLCSRLALLLDLSLPSALVVNLDGILKDN